MGNKIHSHSILKIQFIIRKSTIIFLFNQKYSKIMEIMGILV